MKTANRIINRNRSRLKSWSFVLSAGLFILFPLYCFSQNDRLDIARYSHIIPRPDSAVEVSIVRVNNVRANLSTTLANFRLNPAYRSVVIRNGNNIQPFESRGTVTRNGLNTTLRGSVLPELHIGNVQGEERPVLFQIFIDTMQPLIYDTSSKKFNGTFSILLIEDSETVLAGRMLTEPVMVEITPGTRAKVRPISTTIDHTNLPSTIISVVDESDSDPVPLIIKTVFNHAGYPAYLKKESLLRIETQSRSIQGMGVQTIPLSISMPTYRLKDSVEVTVDASLGTVEPKKVKLTQGMSATVSLTSEGKGESTVKVTSPGFVSDQKVFIFVFPWMFIIFGFIGSLIGSLFKYNMDKSKKKWFSKIGFGMLAGFFFAVLYYVLGIEVFTMKLTHSVNEFAVMGISFLGALFWGKIYDWLNGNLLKTKP